MTNFGRVLTAFVATSTLSCVLVGAGAGHVTLMPASDAKLSDAAMQGDKATVASLLKQGIDVNSAQGDGSTALHWAAYHGDLEMTRALLKAGASVKAATRISA